MNALHLFFFVFFLTIVVPSLSYMHSHTVSLSSPTPGKTVRLLQFNLPHCCSKSWDWITMSITEGTAGADGIGSDGDATLTTSSQPKKRQSAKYCRGLYKNTLSAKSVCFNRASDIYRCFHRENLQVLNDSAVIWQWKKKKKKKERSQCVSEQLPDSTGASVLQWASSLQQ